MCGERGCAWQRRGHAWQRGACMAGGMCGGGGGGHAWQERWPLQQMVRILLECILVIITGYNEVVAKVIFLHLSVIHSVHSGGGGLPQCMLGYHPPGADTPPQQQTPPQTRPPWEQTPARADTTTPPQTRHSPRSRHTPPDQTPPASIRSMSGRYASY